MNMGMVSGSWESRVSIHSSEGNGPGRTSHHIHAKRWTSDSTQASSQSLSWQDATADQDRPAWSKEWKEQGLGATLMDAPKFPQKLFFVQLGFGVDQHGDRSDATKAATRAVRNAIEFNSIPGVIEHIPGGRKEMLIHVKLGLPQGSNVDALQVAKVFPYGRLLPIETTVGGLDFATGRVVEELGDADDVGICVVACISIGYNDAEHETSQPPSQSSPDQHKTYSTKDGY